MKIINESILLIAFVCSVSLCFSQIHKGIYRSKKSDSGLQLKLNKDKSFKYISWSCGNDRIGEGNFEFKNDSLFLYFSDSIKVSNHLDIDESSRSKNDSITITIQAVSSRDRILKYTNVGIHILDTIPVRESKRKPDFSFKANNEGAISFKLPKTDKMIWLATQHSNHEMSIVRINTNFNYHLSGKLKRRSTGIYNQIYCFEVVAHSRKIITLNNEVRRYLYYFPISLERRKEFIEEL